MLLIFFCSFIIEYKVNAFIQKCKLSETVSDCVMVIDSCFSKDGWISLKTDK